MASRIQIENSILPLVAKPNRYIGNFTAARSSRFAAAVIRVLVVHPEVFEAGLGDRDTRAAYAVLNSIPGVAADLAFLPWPDMAAIMDAQRLPLWGLESFTDLARFDLVLFTPRSTLHYAPMLRMLAISGIALPSSERPDNGPLICAAGAPIGNPFPLSPFLDAALLGEPEAVLPGAVAALKGAGKARGDRLAALASVPGVLLFPDSRSTGDNGNQKPARAAVIPLDRITPPDPGLLPLIEAGHEGLTLEIRRGGTSLRSDGGWRSFDRAWEMPVTMAIERAERGLSRTGFDRIDLTGDSPCRHSDLLFLVESLVRRHTGVRLVLPDFGVSEPSPALAREILRGRRSAFQWSPLAATSRLQRVLNQEFDLSRFLEAVGVALRGGCHLVRLRFGIGWPTETDADLDAIGDLVSRVRGLAAGGGAPRIQVQLEPFVPRPHSPFQWEATPDPSEMARRIAKVRSDVEHGPVQVRATSPEQWLVDAILSRGGAGLAPALVAATNRGATSPHVTETWNPAPWIDAFAEAHVDVTAALAARPLDRPLPWAGIEATLPLVVLAEERVRGLAGEMTAPPRLESAAGEIVIATDPIEQEEESATAGMLRADGDVAFGRTTRRRGGPLAPRQASRFRLRFSKGDAVRFTAHLDVARAFERAIRRMASIPGAMRGRGFKLSFGPPLPLGMTGDDEFLDVTFTDEVPETALAQISDLLPDGLTVHEIRTIRSSAESLCQSIDVAEYIVSFPEPVAAVIAPEGRAALRPTLETSVARALAAPTLPVTGSAGDEIHKVDARPTLIRAEVVELEDGAMALRLRLAIGAPGNQRPEALLPALTGVDFDARLARIHRQALRISGAGKEFSPLEVVELDFPWWRETLRKRAAGQRP